MRGTAFVCGCLCAAVVAASCGPSQTSQAPATAASATPQAAKHAFPEAKPSQAWIASIPVGLECYVAKAGTSSPEQVFAAANRKGSTPLLLDLEPGSYEVGFVLPKGSPEPNAEFGPRFVGRLGHAVISKEGDFRVVFTGVTKGEGAASFIGLAFKNDLSADELTKLYPSGNNFAPDVAKVSQALAGRGIDAQETAQALELLKRGGKVLLKSNPPQTTVELKIDGALELVPATVTKK